MNKPLSPSEGNAVYVYQLPMRLWHWITALAVVVLAITGYLIADPLGSPAGEASANYQMGYIRFAHFAAGYVLAIGLLFRIYWAFAGNEHARQLFLPPILSVKFWQGVVHEALWYAFLAKEPGKYVGHNPLAVLAIHILFLWGTLFMIVTGFALYGEGEGMGSWQYRWFSSWVIPLFGQSQDVHTWHHLILWAMVVFMMIHVYTAVRESIMSRQTLTTTMLSGWRYFRDDRPADDAH